MNRQARLALFVYRAIEFYLMVYPEKRKELRRLTKHAK